MAMNVTQKLIKSHLIKGDMIPGKEIALKIDQTLTQDATGTLVMLELEAIGLDRVKTEISVQYVDHNLIQEDYRNPDDHIFLRSAAERFGLHFSNAGNGISHVVHTQYFARPKLTLVGSDSHTPAAGAMGMLAIGAGGLEVAISAAGQPLYITMPKVWSIKLTGKLPAWVSAKDIILELLRRHDVKGAVGYVLEYCGPGLKNLSIMDRHVIANMGAELGATSSVFPSDEMTKEYLASVGRFDDWQELLADDNAEYDQHSDIILDELEPLIACPSSPGNVVPVREVAGKPIYQAYIGSSANPGYRDYAICAQMVANKYIYPGVSFDINPSSRNILEELVRDGYLSNLIHAGARIHQAGCNGCIGMGQAPASGRNSLRTVPRNFPGRSGTPEDSVFLCSPETATASALKGVITDPRTLDMAYPVITLPKQRIINLNSIEKPLSIKRSAQIELIKGPNIISLPEFAALADTLDLVTLLKVGDNISTDEISPAGAKVLPYRSNIPKISEFAFRDVDPEYADKAKQEKSGHIIIAGDNYGQGSSREHAALALRYLGLRAVIAKGFARIHWQNLINFGILPLTFGNEGDYDRIKQGDKLKLTNLDKIDQINEFEIKLNENTTIKVKHTLSSRQCDLIKSGSLINWLKEKK